MQITHSEKGSEIIDHSCGENGITSFGSGHGMKVTFAKEIECFFVNIAEWQIANRKSTNSSVVVL